MGYADNLRSLNPITLKNDKTFAINLDIISVIQFNVFFHFIHLNTELWVVSLHMYILGSLTRLKMWTFVFYFHHTIKVIARAIFEMGNIFYLLFIRWAPFTKKWRQRNLWTQQTTNQSKWNHRNTHVFEFPDTDLNVSIQTKKFEEWQRKHKMYTICTEG